MEENKSQFSFPVYIHNFMNSSIERRSQRRTTDSSIPLINLVSKTSHSGISKRHQKVFVGFFVATISIVFSRLVRYQTEGNYSQKK